MDKIFVISDGKNSFINKLNFDKIEFPDISTDIEIHDYVIRIFENKNIDKLIIPVNLANGRLGFRGLKLGMHIRLTAEIKEKRLIPLIFVSDDKLDTLMILAKNNALNLNYLLVTEGCVLVEENEEEIQEFVEDKAPIKANRFKTQVLDRLKILPSEEVGKHSLANQWGAFRLDEMAHTQAFEGRKDLKNKQKELYFKFIRSFNDDYNNLELTDSAIHEKTKTIISENKKILLIDDEADKGWSDVLSKIFVGADFQFIAKNNFEQFRVEAENKIQLEDWDLILLDLRLNPTEEEKSEFIAEGKIENYSGTKLLQQIKIKNKGTQVIIFTASNKAWNMKALLDLGADGYFIKESPDVGFSNDFSKENIDNFLLTAKSCLDKSYLQDIYRRKIIIEIQLKAKKGISTDYDYFLEDIKTQIDISYDLLYLANDVHGFAYSFFSLYKVLEAIGKKKVEDRHITSSTNYKWNVVNGNIELNTGAKGVFQKIAYIHKEIQFLNDNVFLGKLYWAKERRNEVGHALNNTDTAEIEKFKNSYLDLLEIIESILSIL